MEQLTVALGERSYPIVIGQGTLAQPQWLSQAIRGRRVAIVTNETVAPLYLASLRDTLAGFAVDELILPDGEQFKSLEVFNRIMTWLLEQGHARDTTLIALGGGVIGDITGFAAACYQRGVDFIQVPTTLLSQVDSSVGGKTAVNHPLGKNMIGAFYQPKLVLIDTNSLSTLPPRELAAGLAEVIKYGIIYDGEFFAWLEAHLEQLIALEPEALTHAIARCCQIKAEIVAADETEKGQRALLNLGHTFGHAIEAEMGYGNWLHGEAVGAGMVMAATTAEALGLVSGEEVARMVGLIKRAGLPVEPPQSMHFDDFMRHMRRDKKVIGGQLRLVLPEGIGVARIVADVADEILRRVID